MIEHKVDMYRYWDELRAIKGKQGKPCETLFYGSSTFAIWKSIENDFAAYKAINAGFGGSTSDEALFHYDEIARPFAPKVVLWYYGDNEPVCSYTVEESKQLFMATWQRFLADNPKTRIITIATKTSPARDEYAGFVKELNAWQKQTAAENDWLDYIETADICKTDGKYNLENYLPDQLHFGEKGYAILYKRVKAALDK